MMQTLDALDITEEEIQTLMKHGSALLYTGASFRVFSGHSTQPWKSHQRRQVKF
jgi:hypothetical protein